MKRQRIILWTFLLLLTVLFLFSCKDNGTGLIPPDDTSFRLKVIVKDTAGNPVNGLRVSAWGVLSIENQLHKTNIPEPLSKSSKILASTSLNFSLATRAYVKFSVFNLKGQEINTLVDGILVQGWYEVTWGLPSTLPSGVYKCLLTTNIDTIHFRDSIYAVYHNLDAERNVIGWTTPKGSFEVTDAFIFPTFFDIPPLVYTHSNGPDSLGTFYYTDSVAIVLTDTTSHKQQNYVLKVGKQNNTFDLTWNPPSTLSISMKQDFPLGARRDAIGADTMIEVRLPAEWKLYQNYPNPFN